LRATGPVRTRTPGGVGRRAQAVARDEVGLGTLVRSGRRPGGRAGCLGCRGKYPTNRIVDVRLNAASASKTRLPRCAWPEHAAWPETGSWLRGLAAVVDVDRCTRRDPRDRVGRHRAARRPRCAGMDCEPDAQPHGAQPTFNGIAPTFVPVVVTPCWSSHPRRALDLRRLAWLGAPRRHARSSASRSWSAGRLRSCRSSSPATQPGSRTEH